MSTHDTDHPADGHDEHEPHITPLPVYFGIFFALLFLTGFTVWIAQFHFGSANTAIAMLVATVKASLVALFFMHLLHDEKINSLAFVFGLIFMALFFLFTMLDTGTREKIDPIRGNRYQQNQELALLRVEAEQASAVPIAKAAPFREDFAAADERGTAPVKKAPKPVAPVAVIEVPAGLDADLAAKGKTVFGEKGCAACHSIDGSRLVGPTMKGAFGRTDQLEGGGSVVIGMEYFSESIKEPMAKIVKGYPPAMAKLEISDDEIKALAEYVRSLGVTLPSTAKPVEAPAAPADAGAEADAGPEADAGAESDAGVADADAGVAEADAAAPAKAVADPNADTDGDGIADGVDKCVDQAETENGFEDDDGCPDERPTKKVEMKDGKLQILEKVFFVSNKFDIAKDSLPVLDQLARVLKEHPEVTRIEIGGHTDNAGKAGKNKRLSFDRAFTVRKYLARKGVESRRMRVKGFGGDNPLVPNDTERNRAKNRRVEFNIIE